MMIAIVSLMSVLQSACQVCQSRAYPLILLAFNYGVSTEYDRFIVDKKRQRIAVFESCIKLRATK